MIFESIVIAYAFYIGGSFLVIFLTEQHADKQVPFGMVICGIFISVTNIAFVLWTIFVAKSARNEIKGEECFF